MPYITQASRLKFQAALNTLKSSIKTTGELNYVITRLCAQYVERGKIDYNALNTIVGVLECAKNEFYRRKAASYEDRKQFLNGDVY